MADGTLPRIKLGQPKKPAEKPKDPDPVFYPERLSAELVTEKGVCLVQGKNLFTHNGKFIAEAPEGQWYITTPEMEANNRKAKARFKAASVSMGKIVQSAQELAKVVEIRKENAMAEAAEAYLE